MIIVFRKNFSRAKKTKNKQKSLSSSSWWHAIESVKINRIFFDSLPMTLVNRWQASFSSDKGNMVHKGMNWDKNERILNKIVQLIQSLSRFLNWHQISNKTTTTKVMRKFKKSAARYGNYNLVAVVFLLLLLNVIIIIILYGE